MAATCDGRRIPDVAFGAFAGRRARRVRGVRDRVRSAEGQRARIHGVWLLRGPPDGRSRLAGATSPGAGSVVAAASERLGLAIGPLATRALRCPSAFASARPFIGQRAPRGDSFRAVPHWTPLPLAGRGRVESGDAAARAESFRARAATVPSVVAPLHPLCLVARDALGQLARAP